MPALRSGHPALQLVLAHPSCVSGPEGEGEGGGHHPPPPHAYLRLPVAGAKLEDSEVRSVASNQSEMEFSSLQDMVRPLS